MRIDKSGQPVAAMSVPLALAFLMVSLCGCISTSVVPLNNKKYAPVHPDEVTVYLEEADIPGEFDKVAVLHSRGDYAWTDEARLFKNARKKAAKIGANGLLVRKLKEPNTGDKVAQVLVGTEAKRRSEMIAIYVKRGNVG